MKRLGAALALLAALLCLAPDLAGAQSADRDLDPGVQMNFLIMEGKYFRIEPEQYLREGLQVSIVGNHRYAVSLLNKAIDSGGLSMENLSQAYVTRGISLRALGKKKESLFDMAKALEAMPSSANAHYQLAETLKDMGKTTEAIMALNQAVTLKPNYAQAYYLRGILWRDKGEYNLAAKDFAQCITHDSSIAEAYLQRARMEQKLGRIQEALADFKEYSLRQPLDNDVKMTIGQLERQVSKGKN